MTANPSESGTALPKAPATGGVTGRRKGRRLLAIELVILLVIPVALGAAVGWYFINPPQNEIMSTPGSEAHQLLTSSPDDHLVVEVAYQSSGTPPPLSALSTLSQRINETCSKSDVSWSIHPFTSSETSYNLSDLRSLTTTQRQTWPGLGTMSLFYLYLNGGYAPDSSVLGLAFEGSSIAIFEGTIAQATSAPQNPGVTATVMVHEFGHELGLVGIVGSAPNEDPAHPYHSNDPNDVMYWSVDTTTVLLGFLGGAATPTQFDAADINDLSTVRSTIIPIEILPWIILVIVLVAAVVLVVRFLRQRRGGSPPPS
jgi:hypothetical protein